jgi:hypothetical protein
VWGSLQEFDKEIARLLDFLQLQHGLAAFCLKPDVLPHGWLVNLNDNGEVYFINQSTAFTTTVDPRGFELVFAGWDVHDYGNRGTYYYRYDDSSENNVASSFPLDPVAKPEFCHFVCLLMLIYTCRARHYVSGSLSDLSDSVHYQHIADLVLQSSAIPESSRAVAMTLVQRYQDIDDITRAEISETLAKMGMKSLTTSKATGVSATRKVTAL